MGVGLVDSNSDLATAIVSVGGKTLDDKFQIVSLEVENRLNRIPVSKIVMLDGDMEKGTFPNSELSDFKHGAKVSLSFGYHTEETKVFEGVITSLQVRVKRYGSRKVASQFIIECSHEMVSMKGSVRSQFFKGKKDSEVMSSLAKDHGVTASVESTDVKHENLVQYNSCDWDFFKNRARANGLVIQVTPDSKVKVAKPQVSKKPAVSLDYGMNVLDFDCELNAVGQLDQVKVSAWDSGSLKAVDGSSKDLKVGGQSSVSAKTMASAVKVKPFEITSSLPIESSELKAWASGIIAYSRMSSIRGKILTLGVAEVRVNDGVQLEGFGGKFNGIAYVSGYRHFLKSGKWFTEIYIGLQFDDFNLGAVFKDGSDWAVSLPRIDGVHKGKVNKLDGDPQSQGRLLVDVPSIEAGGDGLWARLCQDYASSGAGLFFVPEKGDEVVLAFENGDPRFPIIVGSIYGKKNSSPEKLSSSNAKKMFQSPKGLKMLFDDESKEISFETPGGNKLVLSDNSKGITLEDSNQNSMKMGSSGVEFSANQDFKVDAKNNFEAAGMAGVDLKSDIGEVSLKGFNVSAKADLSFEAEGGLEAKVSSSSILTLKGTFVFIN
ncbi:type VI secretion system tip protein VgrG [Aureibacter tunicatorum]|uniref:Rhs element Vgr protein n=1 Tax=Aureibacter tunicatorum TaxID=866807 RepID=A0AAE4BVE5_9BACT|nr:type VI secretion system tip protein VgrG [Aureibacter tunicatorum]MDR6241663.1 Rhs element Vgr protein [Aureibacter tunicatorum]BDD07351.1 type IV secretion protein Rhs [Aureibacter tunicatorum]